MAGTLQTPAVSSPNSSEEPKIPTAISTLNGLLTSSNLLDGAQLGAGTVPNAALAGSITAANLAGSIGDSKLSSPNNSVYRTLLEARGMVINDAAAATFLLGSTSSVTGSYGGMAFSGGGTTASAADSELPPAFVYFDDADYTVGGLTQKLRLRCQVAANATAPAINFTFGLYPLTVAGGTDIITFTTGAVVPGSTQAINTPSASTVTQAVNSDFTIPADGAYVLAVVTSGAIANNSAVSCHAQLQTRNV